MAFDLVGTLISQLTPYVQEEYATFKDVNKFAEKLSSNLTAIRAVLKDADEKQITSDAVKDWLQKLTDAAHVLEDILDECSIVSEAYREKFSIIHPKKLYARRSIGKKMKNVAERIDAIAEERVKFGLNPGTMEHRLEDDVWRQTTSVITEPQIHGRDADREKVVEFLLKHACERDELSVYSIVGHGGYGKTALAQLVFNDERVNAHFPLKIWVCVSDDFNITKLFRSIIEIVDGKNPDLISLESMQKKVQQILQTKRYLLVLDDVWSEDPEKWSRFKYPLQNGTKGASILVTTRLETVANIVGNHPAHHLVGLSDDDIWSLFRQQAFGPNGEERAELARFGLAELHTLQLGGKLHIKCLENVANESDARRANLIGKKELSHLYLSWSGDANSQGTGTSAEQVLEALEPHTNLKYFGMKGYKGIKIPNWMRNTSILEGLVEVILYKCRNCDRLPPLGKLPCLTTLYVSGMRDVKYIDDDLYEGATKKAFPSLKKMSLHDLPNLERVLKAEGVEMLSQLSDLSIERIPKLAFPSLPSVETLRASGNTKDLSESLSERDSNNDGASFLKGIAASMHNLKKLVIENFYELKVLPNELNSLSSLQELYISGCFKLESLPECVLQGLSSLQVLRFLFCSSLKSLPAGMKGLTCLESLGFTLCSGLKSLPEGMTSLTSLQKLEINSCRELASLPASFKELKNLHELRISMCPILEKKCKKETGEEWHKIAHVPKLELEFEYPFEHEPESLFHGEVMSLWNKRKQFWRKKPKQSWLYNEFDGMVDDVTNAELINR
ncbi:hypothetical protein TSUD_289500 [Trifolium subterraneum]|uniref:Uncharacterized protein n=1 Tax=Trifolium subterraneum TaxID=3900 RepID=A0A2Z6MZK4_TRISU|nr:hypothetical protein TSUD_289500 [Trifolium subterraneum]